MNRALARRIAPAVATIRGAATATTELLRSPASGVLCVHWRLRVVEHVTPRMQLVHEMASEEAFELSFFRSPAEPPARVRIDPTAARIEAAPVLHREGSPAAVSVGQQLGLLGPARVEEVCIHLGEALEAEGVLDDPGAVPSGPFRGDGRLPELHDALVRVPTRAVGPVLLPWALGTAAALLGGLGAATYAVTQASASAGHGARARTAPTRVQVEVGARKPTVPRLP